MLILGVQMVPLSALIIPLYIQLSTIGLTNELRGVIITHLTFVLPFTVWTLRGFLLGMRGTDRGPLMAAATLTALPVLVFFLLIHRKIAFGLTAGTVRG